MSDALNEILSAASAVAAHASLTGDGRPTPAAITLHALAWSMPPALLCAVFGYLSVYERNGAVRYIDLTTTHPEICGDPRPVLVDEEDQLAGLAVYRGTCRALGMHVPPLASPARRPFLRLVG